MAEIQGQFFSPNLNAPVPDSDTFLAPSDATLAPLHQRMLLLCLTKMGRENLSANFASKTINKAQPGHQFLG